MTRGIVEARRMRLERKLYRVSGVSISRLLFVLSVLLGAIGSSLFVCGIYGLDEGDVALSAIERAESAMGSAYEAVLEAEGAGANVSGLLDELSVGAEALAKARMFYRVGDFDEAIYFADLGYDSVVDVAAKADEAGRLAKFEEKRRLYLTSAASTLGVCCVVFGGIFGWRVFKRRYFRRVLKMKPEVVNNES